MPFDKIKMLYINSVVKEYNMNMICEIRMNWIEYNGHIAIVSYAVAVKVL